MPPGFVRTFTLRLRPKPSVSTEDHRRLVELLRRGGAKGARDLHRGHRDRLAGELVDVLQRHRPRHL